MHIIEPVPTQFTKGVIVFTTVYGNVVVGPTAVDQPDKEDRSTGRPTATDINIAAGSLRDTHYMSLLCSYSPSQPVNLDGQVRLLRAQTSGQSGSCVRGESAYAPL